MTVSRRKLILGGGAFLIAGTRAFGQDASAPTAQPQARAPQESLPEALRRNRLPLAMSDPPPDPAGTGSCSERGMRASR